MIEKIQNRVLKNSYGCVVSDGSRDWPLQQPTEREFIMYKCKTNQAKAVGAVLVAILAPLMASTVAIAQDKAAPTKAAPAKTTKTPEPFFTGELDDFMKLSEANGGRSFIRQSEGKPVVIDAYFLSYTILEDPFPKKHLGFDVTALAKSLAFETPIKAFGEDPDRSLRRHTGMLKYGSSELAFSAINCQIENTKIENQLAGFKPKQPIRMTGFIRQSAGGVRLFTVTNCTIQ